MLLFRASLNLGEAELESSRKYNVEFPLTPEILKKLVDAGIPIRYLLEI